MRHPYPRTERDLRQLAVGFTAGLVTAEELPGALEQLAANMRLTIESQLAINYEPNSFVECNKAAFALVVHGHVPQNTHIPAQCWICCAMRRP